MRKALLLVLLGSLAVLLGAAGCGTSVEHASSGAAGSGGSHTSTGTGGSCGEGAPECVPGCGGDVIDFAECVGGAWQCEPGWTLLDDCPPGSCFGLPEACETCPDGWACEPDTTCVGSCQGIVCLECPDLPGTSIFGACACTCDEAGNYGCTLAPGCCNVDMECGDAIFVPCVAHVCKYPEPDACWSDAECAAGEHCEGASVCPCGAKCSDPDMPGACVP